MKKRKKYDVAKKSGKSSKRKYRRNPLVKMIGRKEGKHMIGLLRDGAVLLGGVTFASFAVDKLTEKFPMLAQPSFRIGTLLALSTTAYVVGTRTKKIPAQYVNLIALGMLMPLVTDVLGLVKSGIDFPALAMGSDKDYIENGTSAWVPERGVSAWVPKNQGMSYSSDESQSAQY